MAGEKLFPAPSRLNNNMLAEALYKRLFISYFLTDEKVCKESPRTSRMVLGLPRRAKGEVE